MNALGHFLGLDDPSGGWYLWWSGAGADLSYLGIIGLGIGWLRRHNCHAPRCHRLARIPVEDGPFMVCARHHTGDLDSLRTP